MIMLSGWDIFNKLWSLNNSSKDFRTTARKVTILSYLLHPGLIRGLDAFSFFNLKEFCQMFNWFYCVYCDLSDNSKKNCLVLLKCCICLVDGRKASQNNFSSEPHSSYFLVRATSESSSFDIMCLNVFNSQR